MRYLILFKCLVKRFMGLLKWRKGLLIWCMRLPKRLRVGTETVYGLTEMVYGLTETEYWFTETEYWFTEMEYWDTETEYWETETQ